MVATILREKNNGFKKFNQFLSNTDAAKVGNVEINNKKSWIEVVKNPKLFYEDKENSNNICSNFMKNHPLWKVKRKNQNSFIEKTVSDVNPLIEADDIQADFQHNIHLKNVKLLAYEKDVKLKTSGNMLLEGIEANAKRDIILEASQDLKIVSTVSRQGDDKNYKDTLTRVFLSAGRNLFVNAGQDLILEGIHTDSGLQTKLHANRHLMDKAVALAIQTFWQDGENHERTRSVHQDVSKHTSKGDFVSKANGVQIIYANIIDALNILIEGDQGVYEQDVHDTYEYDSKKVTKGEGWFESDSTDIRQVFMAMSKGVHHKANQITVRSIAGPLDLTNITYIASQTLLESIKAINFHVGTNQCSSVQASSDSNIFWTSQDIQKQNHITIPNINMNW